VSTNASNFSTNKGREFLKDRITRRELAVIRMEKGLTINVSPALLKI